MKDSSYSLQTDLIRPSCRHDVKSTTNTWPRWCAWTSFLFESVSWIEVDRVTSVFNDFVVGVVFLRSLSFVLRPQFITFIVNYMHICNVLYMWMAIKHHPCHVINIKTYMILSGCGALALYMKKVNCMRIEKYD